MSGKKVTIVYLFEDIALFIWFEGCSSPGGSWCKKKTFRDLKTVPNCIKSSYSKETTNCIGSVQELKTTFVII